MWEITYVCFTCVVKNKNCILFWCNLTSRTLQVFCLYFKNLRFIDFVNALQPTYLLIHWTFSSWKNKTLSALSLDSEHKCIWKRQIAIILTYLMISLICVVCKSFPFLSETCINGQSKIHLKDFQMMQNKTNSVLFIIKRVHSKLAHWFSNSYLWIFVYVYTLNQICSYRLIFTAGWRNTPWTRGFLCRLPNHHGQIF